jgi:pyruvate/2-oxoglutarate dehydrogenase complex dihydrolipoamide acyltransferase (E2) component
MPEATTVEFRLPDIGEGIAEAEIVAWRVAVGDHVREHDELAEIQTDKAIVNIPAPVTGVVEQLCAQEGESLAVGAVLAVFRADDAPAAAAPPRPRAAPATRARARELGLELAALEGSGPDGRILRQDVERAAAPAAAVAPDADAGEVVPLRGTRRAIARAMTEAWQQVPRITDYREVDATELVRCRRRLVDDARGRGEDALAAALTFTPLIARAVLACVRDHPYVNASIDLERDEITLHGHRHLGIAAAGPDGLVVPVVRDADRRTLAELALEIAGLAAAARERRLRPEQLAGPTLTVNNYGGLGIWLGTPIVRPPEVVNFGVGAIRDTVVAVDGAPVVRPTLVVAAAGDHRVLDGHTLGVFVSDVVRLLEDPLLLLRDSR